MDGIERLLEDFNRIKAACQEMERKKIRVGIVEIGRASCRERVYSPV